MSARAKRAKSTATLIEFFDQVYLPERDLLPESWRQLRMSLEAFEEFAARLTIDKLHHAQLNRWPDENPRGRSPKDGQAPRGRRASRLGVCLSCRRDRERPDRLRIRLVKVPRRIPDAWSLDKLRTLYDAADGLCRYMPNSVKHGDQLRAVINVGSYNDLCAADLMTLCRADLSPNGRPVEQQKKRGAHVLVVIPQFVIDEINRTYPPEVE
jgi:hypothetical protein